MISVVGYRMDNLGNIENMYKRIKVAVNGVSDLSEIKGASRIVLPGVENSMRR